MEYVTIPRLGIKLSRLSFGCWQLGGRAWGAASEDDAIKAAHKALEIGINIFDTAPNYGHGHSEETLGKLVHEKRKELIVATKVGAKFGMTRYGGNMEEYLDCSPATIYREVNASLKRLNTDYIDIYQIHWPDPRTPIEEIMTAMEKLRASGKIRFIGCCNFPLSLVKQAQRSGRIDTIQIEYNLIVRNDEKDLLPYCRQNDIPILVYSPIARGLLSGKYDINTHFAPTDHRSTTEDGYFKRELLVNHLKIVEKAKTVANKLSKTPSQIAVRWVLENPDVTTVIFGAKNLTQFDENIAALNFTLTPQDLAFLGKPISSAAS